MKIQQLLETTDTKEWTEEQQLKMVAQNGLEIKHIISAGIIPSEQVQLAAIKQNGWAIEDLIKAGITPSKLMQLTAVTQNVYTIRSIIEAGIQISDKIVNIVLTQPKSIKTFHELNMLIWRLPELFEHPRIQNKWIKYFNTCHKYFNDNPAEYKRAQQHWRQEVNRLKKELIKEN